MAEHQANTKDALLALLWQAQKDVVSGEDAARRLGVSRAAVWKAVQALRAQGVPVEARAGSGYCFPAGYDVLDAQALGVYMPAGVPVRFYDEADSTNAVAKRWALDGAPHGALVAARSQTAGRGRMGRCFSSPPGGLYFSVVLRPGAGAAATLVTVAAAVAVCRAVLEKCGVELGIKWVNDLYYCGKKCCGILTEAGTSIETGEIDYMVVGIGLNYSTPVSSFEDEVAGIATSLFPDGNAPVPGAELLAAAYSALIQCTGAPGMDAVLQEYRSHSIVLGREVQVLAEPAWVGRAVEIDNNAHLVVQRADGQRTELSYGEVRVKMA